MIQEAFMAGGYGMFPTLAFGMLLCGFAVRYAIEPAKRFVPLLLTLGVVTLTSGALGFVTGFIKSVNAVANEGALRPVLGLIGAGEAANCIALALALVTLAAIAASAGAFRIARQEANGEV